MSNNTSITREQLSVLFWGAEIGGDAKLANRFSYAEKGQSTYSFGMPQFDVGNDDYAKKFLRENGFSQQDIADLSKHGGLSHERLKALDSKLQAIPQEKIDQFTNQHLDRLIEGVDKVIDEVRRQNPAAAVAIRKDPTLQLSIADYENQFGPAGSQLIGFLAGKPEKLQGGIVQAGDPPTRDDLLNFVHHTKYGQNSDNTRAVQSRNERFDEAMGKLKLDPVAPTRSPASVLPEKSHNGHRENPHADQTHPLAQGTHGQTVHKLQVELAALGYQDKHGHPLKADGVFGVETRHAVERFQHDHHLTVDGKVGPITAQALDAALKSRAQVPSLTDTKHPDHLLYQQAYNAVTRLDTQLGRTPDAHTSQLAGALVVAAKQNGLHRIDQVLLSEDGSRAFAVADDLSTPNRKVAFVDTASAVHMSLTQSSVAAASVQPPLAETIAPLSPMPYRNPVDPTVVI